MLGRFPHAGSMISPACSVCNHCCVPLLVGAARKCCKPVRKLRIGTIEKQTFACRMAFHHGLGSCNVEFVFLKVFMGGVEL